MMAMNANGALCVSAHIAYAHAASWKRRKRFCSARKNFAWPKRGQWQMNIYYVKMQLYAQSCSHPFVSSMVRSQLRWKALFCDDSIRAGVLVLLMMMVAQMLCIVSYQLPRHRIDALKTVQIYLTSFVWYVLRNGVRKSGKIHRQTHARTRTGKHNCFKREKLNYSTVYVHSTNTNECSAINYLSYFDGLAIFIPHFGRFH